MSETSRPGPEAIAALFQPRSVAIVGASQREDSIGFRVIRNLRRGGFEGAIHPIHPRFDTVADLPCRPSLSALDAPVDAVFVGLPAAQVPDILDEAGRLGIKAAFANAAGFADGGPEGRALQDTLEAVAARHGMAFCGPNNLGIANIQGRAWMWTPRFASAMRPGPLAVISQSGTMALMLSQDEREIGLACLVTCGNEAVLGAADYLAHVVEDPAVTTVLMFLETIRDPARFEAAARRAAALGKRIVAMKSGASESGRALVAAHTGALAGEDRFYDAFLRDCGVVRVHNPDELIETALLLSRHAAPPPRRDLCIVTLSGGEAALMADNAATLELPLPPLRPETASAMAAAFPPFAHPGNPLDAWGLGFDGQRFRIVLDALTGDPDIGAIAFSIVCTSDGGPDGPYGVEMAQACLEAAGRHDKKLVFINATAGAGQHRETRAVLDRAGIPYLSGMRTALVALQHWLQGPPAPTARAAAALPAAVQASLAALDLAADEATLFERMRTAGLPMARCAAVTSAAQAVEQAAALGLPVALKGCAPALPHKSDRGLVKLGLAQPDAVRAAFGVVGLALDAALASGAPRSIVVQAMAEPGIELIVAVRNDPALGSFVVVGPGGLLVELVGRAAIRRGPIDEAEAARMLDETPAGRLLAGYRGKGPYDRAAAAAAIATLSRIGAALAGRVATIEINPLIVQRRGACAVDLLIEPAVAGQSDR